MISNTQKNSYLLPRPKVNRKIYVFCHNFGSILHYFIEIRNLTLLFGKNGNGKSTAQDAIKAIHITEKNFIILNAGKSSQSKSKSISLDNYLQMFTKNKIGPSILGFYIIESNEKGDIIRNICFGFGADGTDRKYFYCEGISIDYLNRIIKKSLDYNEFKTELKNQSSNFEEFLTIEAYHKKIHSEGIVFYDFDKNENYKEFLRLMRDLTNAVQNGRSIDQDQIKNLLFPRMQKIEESNHYMKQLIDIANQMKVIQQDINKSRLRHKSLQDLLAYHKTYYLDFLGKKEIYEIKKIEENKNENDKIIQNLQSDLKRFEEKFKEQKNLIEKNKKDQELLVANLEHLDSIKKTTQECKEYYIDNHKIIFTDVTQFENQITEINQLLNRNYDTNRMTRNSIKTLKKKIIRQTNEITELAQEFSHAEENLKKNNQIKDELSTKHEETIKIKGKLEENIKILQNNLAKIKQLQDELNEKLKIQSNFKGIKIDTKEDFNKWVIQFSKENQDNLREREKLEKEIINFEAYLKPKNILKPKYPFLEKMKQIYEFFEESSLQFIQRIEPFLEPFKDYYVVLEKDVPYLKDQLTNLTQLNQNVLKEINFLIVPDYDIFSNPLLWEHQVGDRIEIAQIKELNIMGIKELKTPHFFGRKTRENHLEDLKKKKSTLDSVLKEFDIISQKNQDIEKEYLLLEQYQKDQKEIIKELPLDKFKIEIEAQCINTQTNYDKIIKEIEENKQVITTWENKLNDINKDIKKMKKNIFQKQQDIKRIINKNEDLKKERKELELNKNQKESLLQKAISLKNNLRNQLNQVSFLIERQIWIEKLEIDLGLWGNVYRDTFKELIEYFEQIWKKLDEQKNELSDLKIKYNVVLSQIENDITQNKKETKNIEQILNKFENDKKNILNLLKSTWKKALFDDFCMFPDSDFNEWFNLKYQEIYENLNDFDNFSNRFNTGSVNALIKYQEYVSNISKLFDIKMNEDIGNPPNLNLVIEQLPQTFSNFSLINSSQGKSLKSPFP